ncbi:HET-domain-containing protein [Apiospora kogelbergensis]|uniref:HET-domain-containing protein n=1 Tax=Apiospora kogelbergensis TaxID=1337665 RepID=A0AAW0R5F8_9PEZI
MRLLDVKSLQLEEFVTQRAPKYAILSHTWEDEEISFKEMSDLPSESRTKKGYKKITATCRIALQDGYDYVWIDTCCIDKSSSAELTEAINSMFRWYQRADICYAYLSDLPVATSLDAVSINAELRNCRYFTRGWTLQELIAPREVVFFDQDWQIRGSRSTLAGLLSDVTGIKTSILKRQAPLSSICVAQKLSWAASRNTTRIEDTAYCLLGIFDVNMPLLYGEEEKAFRRLQYEIIKGVADMSIFSWQLSRPIESGAHCSSPNLSPRRTFCGLLADSPRAFAQCGSIERLLHHHRADFSVSNNGIKTRLRLVLEPILNRQGDRYMLPLDCVSKYDELIAIRLRKCGADQFVREDPWSTVNINRRLIHDRSLEQYLLIDLPQLTSFGHEGGTSRIIEKMRSSVLRIKLPKDFFIYDAWDGARFDDEDYLFFVTTDVSYDLSVLRLKGTFRVEFQGRNVIVGIDLLCYALGWSSASEDDYGFQYTLLDYKVHEPTISELQSQISTWDLGSIDVLRWLLYHRIPRSYTYL